MKDSETVLIRPACPEDVEALSSLARLLALHVDDPDPGEDTASLCAALFSPDPWCECFVAVVEGTVVGFVLFCRRFEAHTGQKALWIADLAVIANCRGQGVGKMLLNAVQSRALELGGISVSLEVWKENNTALDFYHKVGGIILDDRYNLRLPSDRAQKV